MCPAAPHMEALYDHDPEQLDLITSAPAYRSSNFFGVSTGLKELSMARTLLNYSIKGDRQIPFLLSKLNIEVGTNPRRGAVVANTMIGFYGLAMATAENAPKNKRKRP